MGIEPARLAASDDLLLGETVLALGNPFGLGGTVTRGILSSKSRRPADPDVPMDIEDWLQTDAAINPGNSGGPLINLDGEVIGVNVAVLRDGQGIGFAIPIKRVWEFLSEVFTPELDGHWFGARIAGGGRRLVVESVEAGSPADDAGLRVDDRINALDGRPVNGYLDLIHRMVSSGADGPIRLGVVRGEEPRTIRVRMKAETEVFNASLIRDKLGVSVQPVTPDLVENLRLSTGFGLVIAGVDRNSPAARAMLQPRHVILAIDGTPAGTVVDAARVLHRKHPGDPVRLEIRAERVLGRFVQPVTVVVDLRAR